MAKKILPKKFWMQGDPIFGENESTIHNMSREKFLQKLKIFGEQENIPNISWTGVQTLRFFLGMKRPKKVMEIGCANGFSTIVIANELEKWDGKIITCDVSSPSIASAKANWGACRLQNIEVREGSALEVFDDGEKFCEEENFDFIFIDGQKSWTKKFFVMAEKKLTQDGIIIVDDTKKFTDKMKSFKNYVEQEKNNWIFFEVPEEDDALMVFCRR